MAGEEAEALRFLAQEHRGEIAVAEADLAVVRDGTRDAEGLEAFADGFGGVGGLHATFLDRDGSADHVGPGGVVEADVLDVAGDGGGVDALVGADLLRVLDGGHAVFLEGGRDLGDAAAVGLEQFFVSHGRAPFTRGGG